MKTKGIMTFVFCLCVSFVFGQWVDGGATITTTDVPIAERTGGPATFILNRTDGAAASVAAGAFAATMRFPNDKFFRFQSQPQSDILAGNGNNIVNVIEVSGQAALNTLFIDANSNVGIGTSTPAGKLAVQGTILSTEVKVKNDVTVPDYVFESDYNLMPLGEVEAYIKENKHLPEIPSAAEIEADGGVKLSEMTLGLLKKVEELTLHMIEMKKENETLKAKVEVLENK